MMIRNTLMLLILVSLFACANNKLEQIESNQVLSETEKANRFFDQAYEQILQLNPRKLSEEGFKDKQDQWDDLSEEHAFKKDNILKQQLSYLEKHIDRNLLDEQTKISYDLFKQNREEKLQDYLFRFHTFPVNQMYGWQSRPATVLINYHKLDNQKDAEDYIKRVLAVKHLMQQVVQALNLRADKGIIVPKFVFAHVIRDAENLSQGFPLDDSEQQHVIYADFADKLTKLSLAEEVKKTLLHDLSKALKNEYLQGYQHLLVNLKQLEKRASTDDGAWQYPVGQKHYARQLKKRTTTDLTAEQIHQIGLQEVARIHAEMQGIMHKVKFKGSLSEFFKFMREDEQFYYDNTDAGREAYLSQAVKLIDNMKADLDRVFITKPQADLIVKRVEPFREKSAGKAFYNSPAPDGSRPGIYYANLYQMTDMPIYQMEALAYHEGVPGHHMQLAIAQELKGLPKFRKYGGYTAYTEGWGLYSEFLPKEMGYYQDPYSDFGRLAMELWRACRLVVDTGIHAKKWTREQAIDYLVTNTPNSVNDAVKAIERYIVMPGQATAYKIGMLKILELRESAKQRLADKFDIRAFHEVVLANGSVPLSTLTTMVDDWVRASLQK